jgi:hypothetical protein
MRPGRESEISYLRVLPSQDRRSYASTYLYAYMEEYELGTTYTVPIILKAIDISHLIQSTEPLLFSSLK